MAKDDDLLDEAKREIAELKKRIESGMTAYNEERVARDCLARDRARLEEKLAKVRAALRQVEWHHAECTLCGGHQHQGGHEEDCIVKAALEP